MSCYNNFKECTKGDSATFGYAPAAAATFATGIALPFNQVISNASKHCCDFSIRLNVGTGDIFIKEAGIYEFAVHVDTTPAINTAVSIVTGNGESAYISLYNGISGTVTLPVKCNSVVKLVNTGTVAITLTPGTNLSIPLVELTIIKVK
jgi:hypothetical protein